MLIRHQHGEREVWSVVRVPSVEDEDARQLHRELKQLKKEVLQHRLRIDSLLVAQGLKLPIGQDFLPQLSLARLHDGRPVPADLQARLHRE
jgi:transposase